MSGRRILLVEDDEANRLLLLTILADVGYETEGAATLAEMQSRLNSGSYDLLLLDAHLPDGRGPDVAPEIRRRFPDMAIAILTGESRLPQSADVDAVLTKGSDPAFLLEEIERIMR